MHRPSENSWTYDIGKDSPRYDGIRNLVNEFNLTWNDRYLEKWSLESLFSEPIDAIAGKIKSQFGPS